MLASIILALLVATPSPRSQCDASLINKTLRQIEIADYEASATPPPPAVVAELYSLVAEKVAECSNGPQHFMDSKVRDLLQAGDFAVFSGQAYLEARNPTQACTTLREGEKYFAAAYATRASSNLDNLMLQAEKQRVASLRQLLSSKCHRD